MCVRMMMSYHFVLRSLATMTHECALETERNPQLSGIEEINAAVRHRPQNRLPDNGFGASIAAAGDADLGEEQLARKLARGALIGDDEDWNARLLGRCASRT